MESDASEYKNIAAKLESDLKGLSDAYNSLEQANYHLEKEESKVEKLTAKLVELGVDVDKLLEDIGDESQAQGECEDDDDDDR
ncbi:hypothetical protein F2Q69_00035250 [Brassica cretica]|uniref:Uso1/p115-like vesicle tethering protein C-terminal domain-containing protein n=1 Tax=Brassica cretica TaxID=69181 RepID=A0A8S9SE23_BRACR|nr:hypothetical protein F2Q69_00035250 [Brassica cretica]